MSITGESGRAPRCDSVSPSPTSSAACSRRRESRWRSSRAHAAAAGSSSTSACSTRRRRCSPIRPPITSSPAGCPERLGNRHPTIVPYETFEAADGEFVLAVGNDDLWRRFCRVAGLADLAGDQRFATNRVRVEHYDELKPILVERLRTRTPGRVDCRAQRRRRSERGRAGRRGGTQRPPTRRARDDPGRRARDARHRPQRSASPSNCPTHPEPSAPPRRPSGQHTDQILRTDLGLTDAENRAPPRHRRRLSESTSAPEFRLTGTYWRGHSTVTVPGTVTVDCPG